MCNFCNSVANTSGCGYDTVATASSCGCGNSWWGCQRLCRDCCGNIRVRQSNSYCGSRFCGCGSNDGNSTSNNASNGYGGFTCLTFCGRNATTSAASSVATTSNDAYYARQYGLSSYGSCPCSAGYGYDTITQTT